MIEVRNLTKRYGKNIALDDLSFTVEKGQIYGFLGPNGAGKSTAMNIITGYIAANEGSVKINGCDILTELRKARSFIGYLPEQPPLYQEMTVYEYLRFAAELKKIPKADINDAVEESIGILVLDDVRDRLISNLSKGYKQRVGFAQALLGMPEVLILDEPTAGLDPKQIIEIRDLIKKLGGEHTVILSSHILSEVREICDHIMIISKGRLAASGSAEELMNNMRSSAVLKITLLGSEESIVRVMDSLDDIEEWNIEPSGTEDGAFDVRISYSSEEDRRGGISAAFALEGLTIIQMSREEASLEEIFLELTAEEDAEIRSSETDEAAGQAEETEGEEASDESDL